MIFVANPIFGRLIHEATFVPTLEERGNPLKRHKRLWLAAQQTKQKRECGVARFGFSFFFSWPFAWYSYVESVSFIRSSQITLSPIPPTPWKALRRRSFQVRFSSPHNSSHSNKALTTYAQMGRVVYVGNCLICRLEPSASVPRYDFFWLSNSCQHCYLSWRLTIPCVGNALGGLRGFVLWYFDCWCSALQPKGQWDNSKKFF